MHSDFFLLHLWALSNIRIGIEIKQDNESIKYTNLTTNYNIFWIKQSKHCDIKFYKHNNC